MSRNKSLRKSVEFRVVYQSGRRYEGRLMTIFAHPNNFGQHRLGITVSRKVSLLAVRRNRLKRLLREAFAQSSLGLDNLQMSYDWVLNAKRSLLDVKLEAAVSDLQDIIHRLTL